MIIDGVKIGYFAKNIDAEEITVFLHGWGSNADSFLPFFSRTEHFFAFDFPGHGGSSALKNSWKLADFAEITKKIIEKKLPNKKITFVTHSFGGRVLLKMLSQENSFTVEQIIYTGVPFLRPKSSARSAISFSTKILGKCAKILPKSLQNSAKKMWYKCLPTMDYADLQSEEQKKTFVHIISEDLSPYFSVFKQHKSTFIWGENDDMAPIELVKPLAEKYNIPLHVIKNAGHFPFIAEHEKEFFDIFAKIKK